MVLESSPRLTQCRRCACSASPGSASSLMAITAISIPWLRAACSTRNGKRPLPAISPQLFRLEMLVVMEYAGLFHNAALGSFDKFDQLANIVRVGKIAAQRGQRLRGIQLGSQQSAKSALQCFHAFRRKTAAFQPDGICAQGFSVTFSDDARKRRHVLGDDR